MMQYRSRAWIRTCFLAAVLISIHYVSSLHASETNWSFENNPMPGFDTMTDEEDRLFATSALAGEALSSDTAMNAFVAVYRSRYPAAPAIIEDSMVRDRFLRHLFRTFIESDGGGVILGKALNDRLLEEAAQFHADTRRTICTFTTEDQIGDLPSRPQLRYTLDTAREALKSDNVAILVFGFSFDAMPSPPGIHLAKQIRGYVTARSAYLLNGTVATVRDRLSETVGRQAAETIADAAIQGDPAPVLNLVADCP